MNGKNSIVTAQNVEISFADASLGIRIVAYIIDNIIKVGYVLLSVFVLTSMSGGLQQVNEVLIIVVMLPFLFYSLLFEYYMNGQTPGKRMLGCRVVSRTGESLTFFQVLLRWAARLVDFSLFSGLVALVSAAVTKPHQRLGDMMANTMVSSTRQVYSMNDTIYAAKEANKQTPSWEEIKYKTVDQLNNTQVSLIKEVVNDVHMEDRARVVEQLVQKIEEQIEVKATEKNIPFLKQILKDYTSIQLLRNQ